MIKPGRIPCVNPRCRRTGDASKHPGHDCIICQKCWKLLPSEVTETYRRLERKRRQLGRLADRKGRPHHFPVLIRLQRENYQAIWTYFNAPEKPEGLERHLEEMGWVDA